MHVLVVLVKIRTRTPLTKRPGPAGPHQTNGPEGNESEHANHKTTCMVLFWGRGGLHAEPCGSVRHFAFLLCDTHHMTTTSRLQCDAGITCPLCHRKLWIDTGKPPIWANHRKRNGVASPPSGTKPGPPCIVHQRCTHL